MLKTIKKIEAGDAYASWLIGGYYESGQILTPSGSTAFPKDKAKALWWKIKSAEDGSALSQFNLGNMYVWGDGLTDNLVERDYGKAFKWLSRAAESGEFFSFAALGELYFYGQGIPQDYKKAFEWFSRSMDHPKAQLYGINQFGGNNAALRLGEMYATGNGVDQDFIQAYKWMKIGGCDPDQHHEISLKGKLSTTEREKADLLVSEWREHSSAAYAEYKG